MYDLNFNKLQNLRETHLYGHKIFALKFIRLIFHVITLKAMLMCSSHKNLQFDTKHNLNRIIFMNDLEIFDLVTLTLTIFLLLITVKLLVRNIRKLVLEFT